MMKVIKKVTNDAELERARCRTFSRRWVVRLHQPILRCRLIRQKAVLRSRLTDRLMRPPYRALVNLGQIQSVHIPVAPHPLGLPIRRMCGKVHGDLSDAIGPIAATYALLAGCSV